MKLITLEMNLIIKEIKEIILRIIYVFSHRKSYEAICTYGRKQKDQLTEKSKGFSDLNEKYQELILKIHISPEFIQ